MRSIASKAVMSAALVGASLLSTQIHADAVSAFEHVEQGSRVGQLFTMLLTALFALAATCFAVAAMIELAISVRDRLRDEADEAHRRDVLDRLSDLTR